MEQGTLGHLLRAAHRLTPERDLARALVRVVSVAREMTGARHGALAVLNPDGTRIARLVTAGPDAGASDLAQTASATPALQEEMMTSPALIRRAGLDEDAGIGGSAPGAPSRRSFLAVPIVVDARPWGHLYLADAIAGEFTDEDAEAVLILSALASTAVAHAELVDRLPASSEGARRELRRGEAMIAMARVLGRPPRLQEVAELIAAEGQQFVEARALVVFLPIGDQLEVVSAAVDTAAPRAGFSLPLDGSLACSVFHDLKAAYLHGDPRPEELGLRGWIGARSALLVPISFVGRAVGVVAAFDRLSGGPEFDPEDERLMRSFSEAAATGIVASRLVQAERAERPGGELAGEHGRLARELHDETLQALGMLRLSLSSALHGDNNEPLASAVESAIGRLDQEIDALRRLIEGLRPAVLEALGLEGALHALADNAAAEGNLEVDTDISPGGTFDLRLPPEVEHALYRTAQEALTNVVRHADASEVRVDLDSDGEAVELRVSDDGRGLGARPGRIGFGLLGMRERVESAGGSFDLTTAATGGTTVRASFPGRSAAPSQATGAPVGRIPSDEGERP